MKTVTFNVWRGDANAGEFKSYAADVSEGMVVLDAVHQIQAKHANDLACRWNCKAGKCGSCSAEVNGIPLPKSLVQEMLATYTRGRNNPNGIDLEKPFELPANIREVIVNLGEAVVVQ